MHGVNDVTILNFFRAWAIVLGDVVPKFILLFTPAGWSARPNAVNFGLLSHDLVLLLRR